MNMSILKKPVIVLKISKLHLLFADIVQFKEWIDIIIQGLKNALQKIRNLRNDQRYQNNQNWNNLINWNESVTSL